MNRKIITTFATALIAGAAIAGVTSTNKVCRIVLETSTQDNLISIPLVECTTNDVSGASAVINATNYVMTTGLPTYTALMYKNASGNWMSWYLFEGRWQAITVVKGKNISYPVATDSVFQRGTALRVYFPTNDMPTAESKKKIYLCGQYNKGAVPNPVTISSGTTSAPVYNLIGVGQPKEYTISALVGNITGAVDTDSIGVPSSKGTTEYERVGGVWKHVTYTEQTVTLGGIELKKKVKGYEDLTSSHKLPAGAGFWYITRATATRTINWAQLP